MRVSYIYIFVNTKINHVWTWQSINTLRTFTGTISYVAIVCILLATFLLPMSVFSYVHRRYLFIRRGTYVCGQEQRTWSRRCVSGLLTGLGICRSFDIGRPSVIMFFFFLFLFSFDTRMTYTKSDVLSFTTLWANSANDKLIILFIIFPPENIFDISWKLSGTICKEQNNKHI